jgi:hypothetical protein
MPQSGVRRFYNTINTRRCLYFVLLTVLVLPSSHLDPFYSLLLFAEMTLNGSSTSAHDPGPPHIEHDIQDASNRYLLKLKSYAKALPYSIDSNSKMQALLDFICMRIVQTVQARDYDPGFLQWDSMLT